VALGWSRGSERLVAWGVVAGVVVGDELRAGRMGAASAAVPRSGTSVVVWAGAASAAVRRRRTSVAVWTAFRTPATWPGRSGQMLRLAILLRLVLGIGQLVDEGIDRAGLDARCRPMCTTRSGAP